MYIFLTVLIVFAAVLLILLVMIQNSKGGGLAAGFASGNQVMGAPKTADFLEKTTWTLIAIIVVLSIIAVGVYEGNQHSMVPESQIIEQVEEAASALPTAPAEQAAE